MKSTFKKLSPINDANISGYEDALNFVFSDKDIRNVAISGPYCSGKSSIIGTYENEHKDSIEFIHISLAHFCKNMNSSEGENNKASDEETIESKLLNQLLQQIPHSNIPLTRFKVRDVVDKRSVIHLSILLSLMLFSVIYIIKFKSWCNWVCSVNQNLLRDLLLFSTEPFFRIVVLFVVLIISTALIYMLVHAQVLNRLIRKICFKDCEIEIGAENEDSFFDKHMDEVIYLFENANVDGIVFEDIDRFDDLNVFERLREINTLANIRIHKNNHDKKPLRFFYLLRDDIFVNNKDRTKFFDFVIPVIPVIDGSNSYNKIISYLKEAELYESFDDEFLRLISLYIDDLRIAKNIINELVIYTKNLEGIELKFNMMLAMLTYKNIFPKDYSDLQLNKGYVHAVFDSKKNCCKEIRESFNRKITKIQTTIDECRNEQLESMTELEDVKKARSNDWQMTRYKKSYNSWNATDYPRRKAAIEARGSERVHELKEQIARINSELSLLEEYTLGELITKYPEYNPLDAIKSKTNSDFEKIYTNQYFDLLKFLLTVMK